MTIKLYLKKIKTYNPFLKGDSMKILRITATGLLLFREKLDVTFYAKQRVNENDKEELYNFGDNYYLNPSTAFIGINVSGKTSMLKVVDLALNILNNKTINHIESKTILGGTREATISSYFLDNRNYICCLETSITSNNTKLGQYEYKIFSERLWEKPINSIKTKKDLTDFTDIDPIKYRNENEEYLSNDVIFVIALNRCNNEKAEVYSLISHTNLNILPITENIPLEVISFLDPTIEKLYFKSKDNKNFVHLKFIGEDELLLNNARELERYLSSGTIKGIITFTMMQETFKSGAYMLIDELENHFNKEIVTTIIRFFMDSKLNRNGGTLIYTTHYPELLDEYNRNDSIYIIRNKNGVRADNLCDIINRNDIKKSDLYKNDFFKGTAPRYEAYIKLKKKLSSYINYEE